jgi:predicted enzyme related to lactoylglutathione lyase
MDLYIYYRVRTEDATRFQARAAAMQQALARDHGIGGALKRRPEAKDGMHTWMEVYAAAPENIETTLASVLSTSGLAELIDGNRHHEYFMDVIACA